MIGTLVLAVTALLAALLYPTISTSIQYSGILDPIPPFNVAVEGAKCSLKLESHLEGCENGQVISGGKFALLACSMDAQSRYSWFPPTDKRNEKFKPANNGGIVLFDLRSEKAIPLIFDQGFPSDFEFVPHGISVLSDPQDETNVWIAAVNHKRSGSVIELFEHRLGTRSLKYLKTVNDQQLLNAPNDVALIGKDKFYATNDIYSHGLLRKVALYFRLAHGRVVFYDGDTMRQILKDPLTYPNGIVTDAAFERVFVVSSLNRQLRIYNRREDTNGLSLVDVVDIGILGDNVAYDESTKSVLVTGHTHALIFQAAMDNPKSVSPSAVVRVIPNTGKDLFYGKKYNADKIFTDDGSLLSGGTMCLSGSGKSIISGLHSKGLIVCDKSFF